MPLGTLGNGLGPYWAYIAPVEQTNLATNPSFEYGTAGWAAYGPAGSAVVGSTSQFQQFGAWAGSIQTESTSGTAGVMGPTFTAANGSAYTVSVYLRGRNAVPYMIGVGDSVGDNLVGSTAFTNVGTWQRYSYAFTEAVGATRRVVIRKTADPTGAANTFYVDGLDVTAGSLTTHIDGDQEGCIWLGAPHNSASLRSGQSRAGGSVIALGDIGFAVSESPGIGMPPLENSAQSYAILDGAQYQRTRARERSFTIASYLPGTTWQHLHALRRAVINAFKIDLTATQQPTRFWYIGAGGTTQIDAVMDEGLGFGQVDGFEETVGVRFIAYDPYWESTTQQGTALAPLINIGSVNYIARRNRQGLWGSLGANNGTTIGDSSGGGVPLAVNALTFNAGGTLIIGGGFGTLAGTVTKHLGLYYPDSNRFGTLAGGTINAGPVSAVTTNPGGTIFFGGQFNQIGGTTTYNVGKHVNNAYGTLIGGTINNAGAVYSLLYSAYGTLFVGGQYTSANGTVCNGLAMHTGASYGTLGGTVKNGAARPLIRALALGGDGRLYFGGQLTTIQGTAGTAIGQWNGQFGTLQNTVYNAGQSANGEVNALTLAPDARLYEAGRYDTISIGTARGAAVWNGVAQSNLGTGVSFNTGGAAGTSSDLWSILADGTTGNVIFGGLVNQAGGINTSGNYAVWNGYSWLLPDIFFSNYGTTYAMAKSVQGDFYIAGDFQGTANAASVGTIVNLGMAQAYPTVKMRNVGVSGTARVYQLLNTTTGDGIFFNLNLLPGEEATLDLTPGDRSFQSSFTGNIFGKILPGSNLSTWRLLPGTNYVSHFADSGSVQTSIYWSPRHHSADAGTVFV